MQEGKNSESGWPVLFSNAFVVIANSSLFIWILFLAIACSNNHRSSGEMSTTGNDTTAGALNGLYTGLEEMCWTDSSGKKDCYNDPANPKWKWYHLSYIRIRNDSAFLDQSPISIYKNDTTFSASDGSFYYYNGTLQKKDTTVTFYFKELFCDYCGKHGKPKQLTGILTGKGISINGYLFVKTTKEEELISEHPGSHLYH